MKNGKNMKCLLCLMLLGMALALAIAPGALAEGDGRTVYRAMLIGNENYSASTTEGCITDANRMMGALQAANEAGNQYQSPATRTNLKADEIKTLFKDMQNWGMDADDVTLIFYAGLATIDDDGTASLTGRDGEPLRIAEFRTALDKLPGMKLVIFDCRYLEAQANRANTDEQRAAERLNSAITKAFTGGQTEDKFQVLSAVSMVKSVQSGGLSIGVSAGLMTYYLTEGIGFDYAQQRPGALLADTSGNSAVSMSEALDFIKNRIADLGSNNNLKLVADVRLQPENSSYPLFSKRATAEILSLMLDQEVLSIPSGKTGKVEATIQPSNAALTEVTWISSDLAIATVDNDGLIRGVRPGTAFVTALAPNGMTTQCRVLVRDVIFAETIKMNVAKMVVGSGRQEQLKLNIMPKESNELIFWKSNDSTVCSVDDNGIVQTIRNGNAVITATTETGKEVSCIFQVVDNDSVVTEITVSSETLTIYEGEARELRASVQPAKAMDTMITWTTSNEKVATVESNGLASGIGPGECTLTAIASSGVTATIKVSVKGAQILFKNKLLNLKKGKKTTIGHIIEPPGTMIDLTWESSDPEVVSVDDQGRIEALANGEAAITATAESGMRAVCRVSVAAVVAKDIKINKSRLKLSVGQQAKLSGKVSPGTASIKTVFWNSSNEKVATIDDTGTITAMGVGKATITGRTHNGKKARCLLDVTPTRVTSIQLNTTNETLMLGQDEPLQLEAQVEPVSSMGNRALTWASSNPKVATVDPTGLVTPKGAGSCVIRASSGKNVKDECKITVNVNRTLNKKPVVGKGREVYDSLRQISYDADQLVVSMYYVNRTKKAAKVPMMGTLRMTLETGESFDLTEITAEDKRKNLKAGKTTTYTFRFSLEANQKLEGLNLHNCKVEVVRDEGSSATVGVDDGLIVGGQLEDAEI